MLQQRELHRYRFDPDGALMAIRNDLALQSNEQLFVEGMTCHLDSWPSIGIFFRTGPFYGFRMTNPIDVQIEWLQQHQPTHLVSQ